MSALPFAPPPGQLPMLPNNAKASEQFARLLDALLVLDAEGPCRVDALAERVGLQPARLRELLSAYMVAGAEALGESAPFTIEWGTSEGALGTTEADDTARADVVHPTGGRVQGDWLLGDVGRRPVLVRDVAAALLAATLVLDEEPAESTRRTVLTGLIDRLADAMQANVEAPADTDATALQRAVIAGRAVRFRYRHPWTGESSEVEVEPYDLWRRRDRLVLAAGSPSGVIIYDLNGISHVVELERPVLPMSLAPRSERIPQTPVLLAVPDAERFDRWLLGGWNGRVKGPRADGRIEIAVDLDGDPADPSAADRLGTLLLQLGAGCEVLDPPALVDCAQQVAARLLAAHGFSGSG